jgi:RHS repeat-associated protein
MRTDINGFPTEVCTNEPFGDAQLCQGNETSHHHFTGKERDTETGFDYFGARYYAGGLGHWLTPDWDAKPVSVPYAHFGNPQSLNLYAYVGNNPLSTVDPDGHDQPLLHGTTCQSTPFCSGRGPFYGDMWIKVDPICNFDPVRCGLSSVSLAGSMVAMAEGTTDAKAVLMEAPEAQAAAKQGGDSTKVSAVANGNEVTYKYPDGSVIVRSGTHPWRDDNPGDLISGYGSIGRDSGGGNVMATYATEADGWSALDKTLTTKYADNTILDTMKSYAPGSDGNDPVKYAATLAAAVGVPASTKLSHLIPAQLTTGEINIAKAEGYCDSGNTATCTAPPQQ